MIGFGVPNIVPYFLVFNFVWCLGPFLFVQVTWGRKSVYSSHVPPVSDRLHFLVDTPVRWYLCGKNLCYYASHVRAVRLNPRCNSCVEFALIWCWQCIRHAFVKTRHGISKFATIIPFFEHLQRRLQHMLGRAPALYILCYGLFSWEEIFLWKFFYDFFRINYVEYLLPTLSLSILPQCNCWSMSVLGPWG